MSKNFVSDSTARKWNDTSNEVANFPAPVRQETRRRIRSKGSGGAERPYIIITSPGIDAQTYTGNVLTSPLDNTPLLTDVTIKALQVSSGTIPNGTSFFADIFEGVYYIQPAIIYGE